MTEKGIILLSNVFILFLVLITQVLIPIISRRDILLGVKIPEEKTKTPEVKGIVKGFRRENIIVGVFAIFIISLIIYYFNNILLLSLSPLVFIGILFLVYMRWNKKLKELKEEKKWEKLASNIAVVDVKFSRDKTKTLGIWNKWMVIPLIIIVGNMVLSLVIYPSLPAKVPTHWDFQGNINGYMDKSIFVALLMPIFQLFIVAIMYLAYYAMIKSKQQIEPKNPEVSLNKNIIFRKIWASYFLVTTILLEILFTVLNMMVLGLIEDIRISNYIGIIFPGIMVIGAIIISIKLGQGGDRLRIDDEEYSNEYDIDDDRLWKLGNTIYYNPEDPSVFVEKRIGVGWTVNIGRPLGLILLVIPFIILIITLVLSI